MLVKTPAVKLAVEIRSAAVEGDRLTMSGVANNMPCSVQISRAEVRLLTKLLLGRASLGFVLGALLRSGRTGT